MKLEQGFSQRPEQRLALLPKMLQSIEVLQLNNLELEAMVQKALAENETLELREEVEEKSPSMKLKPRELSREKKSSKASQEASDRHQEFLLNSPAPEKTLRQHLQDQAALLELSDKMRETISYIIENIDEHGYLTASIEELHQGQDGKVTLEEVNQALGYVRSLEPKGVGGRGPVECLLLQLDEKNPQHALLRRLLVEFLEDISKNRLPKVAKAMGLELNDLKEILSRAKELNPRPGSGFAGSTAPTIRPDVVVEKVEDGLEFRIEDQSLPRMGLDSNYLLMSKDKKTPSEVRDYLKGKIDSARWLMDSIEQRRMTLLRVTRAIFAKQSEFLEKGAKGIRPLMMKDVADEVGVHVSTVSRAVANKYAQTPAGIFPLRQFFSAAAEGETESSRVSVREMIRDLIASENHQSPYSDEEIVEWFKKKGIEVARRTVAKYRTELDIPSSWRRRVY